MNIDSKVRFSNRVSSYSKYRPSYPAESIECLFDGISFDSNFTVADVGAGTGILTELLLAKGVSVVAVEPNDAMRQYSDHCFNHLENYFSLSGSAEMTGLKTNSIDLITVAQAFHWFDTEEAKEEFRRILKSEGKIALIWNRRLFNGSDFMTQYEALLMSQIPEYNRVNHNNSSDALIGDFLGPGMKKFSFENYQEFDLSGFKGRLQSSSYCPMKGEEGHKELMAEVEELFYTHARNNKVRFDYCTQIYRV